VWENKYVDTLDAWCGKYAINGDAASLKCWRYQDSRVTPADFGHVKIILDELAGKLTGTHILVEIP
jgi:hypothetical protein